MKHRGWIFFSGLIWFAIGIMLMLRGLDLLVTASKNLSEATLFLDRFSPNPEKREQTSLFLIAIGLLVGYIKGRFVLMRTVRKVVQRICSLPLPMKLSKLYNPQYYLIMVFMTLLGMSMKFIPIYPDLRGVIDVAIGSALMNGAFLFFRFAQAAKAQKQ